MIQLFAAMLIDGGNYMATKRCNGFVYQAVAAAIWVVMFQITGFFIGFITKDNMQNWLYHLKQSALTPPGAVFSIVWTVLYFILAIVGWYVWHNMSEDNLSSSGGKITLYKLKSAFVVQMVLNFLWSIVFFHFHLTNVSVLMIALMMMLTYYLMILLYRVNRYIALLLLPYLGWLSLAFYLNLYIWQNN